MPVDGIDPQIQSLISQAKLDANAEVIESESASDAEEKKAIKRLERKKQQQKNQVQKESFAKDQKQQAELKRVLGGAYGPDVAQALGAYENSQLQQKLTEAQRQQFRAAMAENPVEVAPKAEALARLARSKSFGQAVTNSEQAGLAQEAILKNPGAEKNLHRLFGSRFMQSPNADQQAKSKFLRLGLLRGSGPALDATEDMMGSLAKHRIGVGGQREAMDMAQRKANQPKAMWNVDSFVQQPVIHKLPVLVKTKATEVLARSGGSSDVAEGLSNLAQERKFKSQTAANQGRLFATIGSGKPSEFRLLTDLGLQALRSKGFPKNHRQASKFLEKLSAKVSAGSASGVDLDELLKSAKRSPLPQPPALQSELGLSEEEALKARRQNRATVIEYYNKIAVAYEQVEKDLKSAKYFEDVNRMPNLREFEALDLSQLDTENRKLAEDRESKLSGQHASVLKLHREKMRALRTKRMPQARRKAMAAKTSTVQPRYFQPNSPGVGSSGSFSVSGTAGAEAMGSPSAEREHIPQVPRARGLDIQSQVSNALAQMGPGGVTPEKAQSLAQSIASQVAQQVAQQVTQEVMKSISAAAVPDAPSGVGEVDSASEVSAASASVRTDGWGIPQSMPRELGGDRHGVVKAPSRSSSDLTGGSNEIESYSGRLLVKDASQIRSLSELMSVEWKSLSRGEKALLRNLGWDQPKWDTKDNASARWPVTMATAFVALKPIQRDSIRKLGLTASDWDSRIQSLKMGKNA